MFLANRSFPSSIPHDYGAFCERPAVRRPQAIGVLRSRYVPSHRLRHEGDGGCQVFRNISNTGGEFGKNAGGVVVPDDTSDMDHYRRQPFCFGLSVSTSFYPYTLIASPP